MALGSGKKVEALEAEVANLKQWVDYLRGTDAVALANQIAAQRGQLADLQGQAVAARRAAASAQAEEIAARSQLADDLDMAGLQEAGFYVFSHHWTTRSRIGTA